MRRLALTALVVLCALASGPAGATEQAPVEVRWALGALGTFGFACLVGAVWLARRRKDAGTRGQGDKETRRQRDRPYSLPLTSYSLLLAALFYFSPWPALTLVAGLALAALILLRLDLGLPLVAAAAPFYLYPRALFGKEFSMVEILTLLCALSWGVRQIPNLKSLATDRFDEDQSILFSVCPRERMKPGPEHIRYLVALWSGLDLEPAGYSGRHSYLHGPAQAAKAVRSFHFPPSIVVESGHGLHLYWLLKSVVEISDNERVETLLQRIASHFLCNTQVPLDSFLVHYKSPRYC